MNPLTAYYRSPGIEIKLPSRGEYYNHKIETNIKGEIPVLPMTATDEIIANNPDGLLSGSSVEHIIKSCCPAIIHPRELPMTDVDLILLAVKLVSYGPTLVMESVCPHCGEKSKYDFNIHELIAESTNLPKLEPIRLNDDLLAFIRPYTFEQYSLLSMAEFEESKILQSLINEQMSEDDKISLMTNSYEKIAKISISLISKSILKINTPTGTVSEQHFIEDFINNAPADFVKKIQKKQEELNKYGLPKNKDVQCSNEECKKPYNIPLAYDPSSFFG